MNKFKIEKLLQDHHELHSEFQIENFIIGSQGDSWAQYKQCLREIKARIESIESDEIQLRMLESKNGKRKRFWFKKIAVKNTAGIDSLKNKLNERKRELDCFVKIAEKLKSEIGPITAERRQQLESKSWYNKARKLAAIDLMAYGRVSTKTLEFILSFPKEDAQNLLLEFGVDSPPRLLE